MSKTKHLEYKTRFMTADQEKDAKIKELDVLKR